MSFQIILVNESNTHIYITILYFTHLSIAVENNEKTSNNIKEYDYRVSLNDVPFHCNVCFIYSIW